MNAHYNWLNSLINENKNKFAEIENLKWLGFNEAEKAQQKRNILSQSLEGSWLFKNTKPYHNQISKGCKLCGLGVWSCLFITNKCNASCFYCPASQNNDDIPSTQNLSFPTPESYAEYINYFGFKGVSFSGGEPLLFFERTLQYLKQIRKRCNPEIYVWMYTNGILGDDKKFRKLAEAGLNEIRFDIGATGFNLDKIQAAKGIIPIITIEIPSVPEEKDKLIKMLPEMIDAGVTNLNLHQLRLTLHNSKNLIKRNYSFIQAEQPIVMESELAALEILNFAKQHHIQIGINYCSFYFKNRFQKAGFRKQIVNALSQPDEIITEKGFIREYNNKSISYKTIRISDKKSSNPQNEIKLPHKTYYFTKENSMRITEITPELKVEIDQLLVQSPEEIPTEPVLHKIWQMEYIEKGLREY